MTVSILDAIKSSAFLDEIHKLLWIKPAVHRDGFDSGWSCREHAFISACLAAASGIQACIVIGKAMFMQGPQNGKAPAILGCDANDSGTHAWLSIPKLGTTDISPNLDISISAWRRLQFSGIVNGVWEPQGTGMFLSCSSKTDYENEIALGTHGSHGNRAVYWPQRQFDLTEAMVRDAFAFTNSPLTDWLRRSHATDVLAKAALHLWDRINRRVRSVAGVSQAKAWRIVAQRNGHAPSQLVELTGIKTAGPS
ncbi:MAG: hypothetical protein FJ279_01640 [Planctomycetes bacterium]|nr:hypothetical protein [Planctomycetota bacterium]